MEPAGGLSAQDVERLLAAAREVRARAHAPASRFLVGAAVLAQDGRVFCGCNVENASYGLTICAERAAVTAAVAGGARRLVAVAVATGPGASPCGACRQVLAEFGPDMAVLLTDQQGRVRRTDLSALLPDPFTFGSMP
ncbi:MAG: cytidine deaminase [Planctomycetota bacterium]